MSGFRSRLADAVARHGPLCVGIDPHPNLLEAWGLPPDAGGVERFARGVVEALAGEVAILKPQVALFEALGSAGLAALERTLADARAAGVLTLADAKRGDIGSTMEGYARAWLQDSSPLAADAVTLSPYLGVGALAPAMDTAAATGRGVFVLARTSNPEARSVQSARLTAAAPGREPVGGPVGGPDRSGEGDPRPVLPTEGALRSEQQGSERRGSERPGERDVAQGVVDAVADLNAGALGGAGGVVIGLGPSGPVPDLSHLGGPVLVPGLGAQGGTPEDVAAAFAGVPGPVVPVSAREVLAAGPDPEALRAAVRALNGALAG